MKLKRLSLVAGAFTKCALCALALTLTSIPFAVQAEPTSSSPLLLAQVPKKGAWQELGLTDAQKNQIQTIRQNTRAQIEGILTPEQKAQLQAAKQERQAQRQAGQGQRQAGQRSRNKFAELNLTEQQKTQMRQVWESSKQQMQAVLTPEQQAKLKQLQESRRQRWQQRNSQ
ncbi:P pilus assembly/Cpx signaling pathway, periplasmic inhibitor/zinc-resistance associated protein [Nostoc sp. B(2019)]|nr:P pilus assembly/Cpx signaling pathway, periplasmic inhibitor/zinc-resistance associated protein [Nostoc sp. B(2019)]